MDFLSLGGWLHPCLAIGLNNKIIESEERIKSGEMLSTIEVRLLLAPFCPLSTPSLEE